MHLQQCWAGTGGWSAVSLLCAKQMRLKESTCLAGRTWGFAIVGMKELFWVTLERVSYIAVRANQNRTLHDGRRHGFSPVWKCAQDELKRHMMYAQTHRISLAFCVELMLLLARKAPRERIHRTHIECTYYECKPQQHEVSPDHP